MPDLFLLQVISKLLTIKPQQQIDLIASQWCSGKSKWVWFFNYF